MGIGREYTKEMKQFKEKHKQMKQLQAFFVEMGRVYTVFAKDLNKLSTTAHLNIKSSKSNPNTNNSSNTNSNDDNNSNTSNNANNGVNGYGSGTTDEGIQSGSGTGSSSSSGTGNSDYTYIDLWWNSLSISMDHLSQSSEILSSYVSVDLCQDLARVGEEYVHIEKKLIEDASKVMQQM